eukprot:gene5555-8868_t
MARAPPDGRARWIGFVGEGSVSIGWRASAVWGNGGAWDDASFGHRAGSVSVTVHVAQVSALLSRRARRLPPGSLLYTLI